MTTATRAKSSKKHKTEALGVLLPGGGIKYATDHDKETMKGVPIGTPIALTPVGDRRNSNITANSGRCSTWAFHTGNQIGHLSAHRRNGLHTG